MLSHVPIARKNGLGVLLVLPAAVVMAVFLTGGQLHSRLSPEKVHPGCRTDVGHPLDVRVVPTSPIRPGGVVTAEVEITSRLHLDQLTVRVVPPGDVRLLSTPAANLGLLRAGEVRSHRITLIAPKGGARRVVQIRVEARHDGVPITRGATLNVAFEEEPHRIVTTPDGRRVREVSARRIG